MPRRARVIVPGLPHHIVQRGHNRQPVFVEDADFRYYLSNLEEWKHSLGLKVYSYCLMTNHVHLVVKADDDLTAIPRLMKRLAGRQTRYVNALEQRTGTIWEGRYKISPIDTDEYLLSCCRYVELNPVKAGMVAKPEDYRWSSFASRCGHEHCDWLDEPPTLKGLGVNRHQRMTNYQAFVSELSFSLKDDKIRSAIDGNKLTGGDKFVDEVEQRLGIRLELRDPGRPRKD